MIYLQKSIVESIGHRQHQNSSYFSTGSKANNPTVPEKFWYNSDVISAWPGFDSPLFPVFIKLHLSIQPP